MAPITEEQVSEAIRALQSRKAPGLDGLSNDFYKDCETEITPRLTALYNRLLQGKEMPESFGVGFIFTLRKKEDSPNAMDYRPITLLQSSYKIFAKVTATRVQAGLTTIIGETQQGFVHARLLERSVVLMHAMLQHAYDDSSQSIDDSPAVVLLDFMKAYDMLNRDFILLTLWKFGFSDAFVDLIARLHLDTSAIFMVNGGLSQPQAVVTGIRQRFLLAPLLFIVAAEVLALTIGQDPILQGITPPGSTCGPQEISVFVDDSAVFLRNGKETTHLLKVLADFEVLSGLRVQPEKSVYICLNHKVSQRAHFGILVLPAAATTRYLGVQIGLGDSTAANWDARIKSVITRLTVATRVSTTVVGKVKILNAIMLPALMFTAQFVKPPEAILTKLENIQKQSLWKGQLSVEGPRHKINPELLFSPVQQGGLGLLSIELAVKRQAMRRAIQWLLAERSVFTEAWHFLARNNVAQSRTCCMVAPWDHGANARKRAYKKASIQRMGVGWMSEHLTALEWRSSNWKDTVLDALIKAEKVATLHWDYKGHTLLKSGVIQAENSRVRSNSSDRPTAGRTTPGLSTQQKQQ